MKKSILLIFVVLIFTGCFLDIFIDDEEMENTYKTRETEYVHLKKDTPRLNVMWEKDKFESVRGGDTGVIKYLDSVITAGTDKIMSFDDKGNIKWKVKFSGNNSSGFKLVGDKIWILGDINIIELNAKTGEIISVSDIEEEGDFPDNIMMGSQPGYSNENLYFIKRRMLNGKRVLELIEWNTEKKDILRRHRIEIVPDVSNYSPVAVSEGVVYFGIPSKYREDIEMQIVGLDIESWTEKWRTTIEKGYTTDRGYGDEDYEYYPSYPNVSDGKIIIKDNRLIFPSSGLVCLDKNTGEIRWEALNRFKDKDNPADIKFPSPCGEVIYYEEKLYYLSSYHDINLDDKIDLKTGEGNIVCVDAKTGEAVWIKSMGYSLSASPAVYNGVMYVPWYGLYAFDAKTGDLLGGFERKGGEYGFDNAVVFDGIGYTFGSHTIAFEPADELLK
ncbi:MAG: PQQ-binding-like beta-propeller repeat protein [Fusobacteriota bacterium]